MRISTVGTNTRRLSWIEIMEWRDGAWRLQLAPPKTPSSIEYPPAPSFQEVDFVAERTGDAVLPVEVKFRRKIDAADLHGLRRFLEKPRCP